MTTDENTILTVFNTLFHNIRSRCAIGNIAYYSGDEDCDLIGSDIGEEASGMAGLKNFFEAADAKVQGFDFSWDSTRCTVVGEVAWVFARGSVSGGGAEGTVPYLLTCIFVKRGGSWLI